MEQFEGLTSAPQRVLTRDESIDVDEDTAYCSLCEHVAQREQEENQETLVNLKSDFESYVSRQQALIASLIEWGPVSPSYGEPPPPSSSNNPGHLEGENQTLNEAALALNVQVQELSLENHQLRGTIEALQKSFHGEVQRRKRLHNKLQDLKGKIRVFVRIRPLSPREEAGGCRHVLLKDGGEGSLAMLPDEKRRLGAKAWDFDGVFGGAEGQAEVFLEVSGLVVSAVDGHNVCLFAYGQTGSGKTHTMFGDEGSEAGVAPRAAGELFKVLEKSKEGGSMASWNLSVTMLELYNDHIYDLIKGKGEKVSLKCVTKFGGKSVEMIGAESEEVFSEAALLAVLRRGSERRR